MHDDRTTVEGRLRRVVGERLDPALIVDRRPFAIERWEVPDEPVSAAEAAAADYEPFDVGRQFGKPWGTTWFRLSAAIPAEWAGQPVRAVVDLGFSNQPGFQSEGLFWDCDANGEWFPVRGLNPFNQELPLVDAAVGGEEIRLTLEAASNPNLSFPFPDPASHKETAGTHPIYSLSRAELVIVDDTVEALRHDIRAVTALMERLPLDQPRRHELLRGLEAMLDALDLRDVRGSAPAARAALAPALAGQAAASAHQITAIGHAHIDTAWLWPIRETRRKCARTFTNQLALMERYPEHRFACSQAAQYEWIRESYPAVFEQIRERVAEGRWIPVGGMWVEADTNLAGGEALIRQFTHGQRYFEEHFGIECSEVWIPDVFGYNANLPQLMKHAGISRFLTQKLSWNATNRFPHHSFWWEGIDGSTVFTHFPPVETYNANFSGHELAHAVRTFADKGRSRRSLMPFGHGDGGGGPTADMLEQYRRVRDLDGSAKVEIDTPEAFFDAVIEEYVDAPRWVGELYFELHRGTFTSQAKTKRGNRRCESLLREAEIWCVAAYGIDAGAAPDGASGYPVEDLDRLWKDVLLLQFHDILPGSSIGWVHRETEEIYARVEAELTGIINSALAVLASDTPVLSNPTPFDLSGVVPVVDTDGAVTDRVVALAPHSVAPADVAVDAPPAVTVESSSGRHTLANGVITAVIDADGHLASLVHVASGRDAVAPGEVANVLQTFEDFPNMFDAWDIEDFSLRRPEEHRDAVRVELGECDELGARVVVERAFGQSSVTQTYVLRGGSPRLDIETEVEWHERETLLKASFPVSVHTTEVTREVQLGEYRSAIHTNTSWDAARFEFCALRWIDCSEPGFGVAMLNDSKYGHDVTRVASGGSDRPTTQMRLSLLRASLYPDPEQDQGHHRFTYSVMPHGGDHHVAGVPAQAWLLNNSVRAIDGSADPGSRTASAVLADGGSPVVASTDRSVVIEAVKPADDGGGDVVIRLHESRGAHVETQLDFAFAITAAEQVDGRERSLKESASAVSEVGASTVALAVRPFEVVTLRIRGAQA